MKAYPRLTDRNQKQQRMKTTLQSLNACVAALLLAGAATEARAVTLTVDPGASWLGFMNVSELPANGGTYVFGQAWGTADLQATFSGPVLTLAPNTIADPAEFWYIGGGGPGAPGNKIMDANFYQEMTGPLAGQTVTFTGEVLANSLTLAHTAVAFVKDFAPDYSSSITMTVALSPGVFSVSLDTINDPARHVQFGFQMIGPNVWATDVASFGDVDITAIPEPSFAALVLLGIAGLAVRRLKTTRG
jgi:hypothetical protein